MQAKCLNCEQMGHNNRDFSEPNLAIPPSDFCVSSHIRVSQSNPIWIVCLGIRTKEQGTIKLD